jgi:hypothetical protein
MLSYFLAVPFYLIVERPFKNFLDLILFPKSSIFKKSKDIEDEDSSEDSNEEEDTNDENERKKKSRSKCAFCQDEDVMEGEFTPCGCECLVTKKRCKCVDNLGIGERTNSVVIV